MTKYLAFQQQPFFVCPEGCSSIISTPRFLEEVPRPPLLWPLLVEASSVATIAKMIVSANY